MRVLQHAAWHSYMYILALSSLLDYILYVFKRIVVHSIFLFYVLNIILFLN